MITLTTLPKGYKPYPRLLLCSNMLIGGGHLIVLGKMLPLLVGCGEAPMVWLQGLADKTGKTYLPLVDASVALHPAVSIVSNQGDLTVSVLGVTVIHILQKDPESAVIDLLDLRPIGLDIHGDTSSLIAGGMNISQNTFSGGGTLLAFGGLLEQAVNAR